MHASTQSVTMDRGISLLRIGAIILAALMLSLVFASALVAVLEKRERA